MIEVRAARPDEYGWLCGRIGYVYGPGFRAIAAVEDGAILGMTGFDQWTPNSVQIHVAVDAARCVPKLAGASFDFVFRQAKLGVLVGLTPSDRPKALALNRAFGFRETHRIRDAYEPGVDAVLQEMTRDDCRWLRRRKERNDG